MDKQCSSCGGFCKKSGCERENVKSEPEPVGWLMKPKEDLPEHEWLKSHVVEKIPEDWNGYHAVPLYTAPPQRQQRTYTLRKWQGLTDEDWIIGKRSADYIAGAEWAEAKLKEKNHG